MYWVLFLTPEHGRSRTATLRIEKGIQRYLGTGCETTLVHKVSGGDRDVARGVRTGGW